MLRIQIIKTIYHNPPEADFMEHKEETETVIKCAFPVYKKMG